MMILTHLITKLFHSSQALQSSKMVIVAGASKKRLKKIQDQLYKSEVVKPDFILSGNYNKVSGSNEFKKGDLMSSRSNV
jgi:hypothetical protein